MTSPALPAAPRRPVRRAPEVKAAPPAPQPSAPATLPGDEGFLFHLLRRTTYGITPDLLADVQRAGGAQGWLETQLKPSSIADPVCDKALERFPLRAADPPHLWATQEHFTWHAMDDVARATFSRAVWSKRQLFEVMAEFWSNHLNITTPSGDVWATKPWDDANVIRKHALGRFEDMLVASGTSPAMMQYLDNASSKGTAPNENYGRELLELHTLGRAAGYTQTDVVQCALALTGLTVWDPWNGGTPDNLGTFRYNEDRRYVGPVTVLGWSHPNADPAAGVDVAKSLYRYLANHPATAARIARKLAVRFVADDPPQALVDRLTKTYLDSGTAIVPVLRVLFASPEFAASVGQKYRRPYEDVVASLRAVGAQPSADGSTEHIQSFHWLLEQLGHAPLRWAPPDGYPDVAPAWTGSGTTLGRWNIHAGIAGNWWDKGLTYPDLAAHLLPGGRPATRHDLVTALFARLTPGIAVPADHVEQLVAFLGGAGPVKDADVTWLFSILVALVLDSPHWTVR